MVEPFTKNEWHINGIEFSKEEFDRQIEKMNLEQELRVDLPIYGKVDKIQTKI